MIDSHAAALGAYGILAAYIDRLKTGKGHKVDSCLLNAGMDMQMEAFAAYFETGRLFDKLDTGAVSREYNTPYGVYQTADGYLIISRILIPTMREIFGEETMRGIGDEDKVAKRAEIDAIVCRS